MTSGIVTLALLALFVGGWIWAWRPARRDEFEAAAQLPLLDDAGASPGSGADTALGTHALRSRP